MFAKLAGMFKGGGGAAPGGGFSRRLGGGQGGGVKGFGERLSNFGVSNDARNQMGEQGYKDYRSDQLWNMGAALQGQNGGRDPSRHLPGQAPRNSFGMSSTPLVPPTPKFSDRLQPQPGPDMGIPETGQAPISLPGAQPPQSFGQKGASTLQPYPPQGSVNDLAPPQSFGLPPQPYPPQPGPDMGIPEGDGAGFGGYLGGSAKTRPGPDMGIPGMGFGLNFGRSRGQRNGGLLDMSQY